MDCKMTGKPEANLTEKSISGNAGAAASQGEGTGFLEIASAKLAQKMTNPADESQRSFNDKLEDKDAISFYENFRRRERRSWIARQEKRRFKLEQEAKRKRRAQYVKILTESALKRRLREQEACGKYYTSCTIRKAAVTVCESGSVSVPVSKESIALLLADRELVEKEAELAGRSDFAEVGGGSNKPSKRNLQNNEKHL